MAWISKYGRMNNTESWLVEGLDEVLYIIDFYPDKQTWSIVDTRTWDFLEQV